MLDTRPGTSNRTPRDIAAVLTVFPALYLLHGFVPHCVQLFVHHDHRAWGSFWLTIAILHWTSAAVAYAVLRRRGIRFADLGLTTDRRRIAAAIAGLVAYGLVLVAIRVALGPIPLFGGNLVFGDAMPLNTSEWLRWIPMAITAGFCEELVYRGFGIGAQIAAGVSRRRAVTTATIAFVFLHGFSAFTLFPVYIGLALAMASMYRKRGSLLTNITTHAIIDLTALLTAVAHH